MCRRPGAHTRCRSRPLPAGGGLGETAGMRILVTGGRGKVGAATVDVLHAAGHRLTISDRHGPRFEAPAPGAPHYVQADLTDAGDTFALVRGHDAVVHAAAIPEPTRNPAHVVFANNVVATFNVAEACVRWGVHRLVALSSETVPGFIFAERPWMPAYCPVDEDHPVAPQDPYALAKHFGEQIMDAAVRRSELRCISIRPTWVQWEGNYEQNLGRALRDPAEPSGNLWSYIDAYDLAEALRLAAESELPGHEVFYIASPDNSAGRPLSQLVRRHFGDAIELRPTEREDASGISSAKAVALLGYAPTRSWRDYLSPDGVLLRSVREQLERGDTGVQRGRAAD
jgi:UDP-glucose 4-epimerase